MTENCFKLNIYFFKKPSYLKLLYHCLPSGFSLYPCINFGTFFSTVYKYKKCVQMATAIICGVMIFFFNYSTHVTPISLLPFPNLYRMQQLSLHYFLIAFYLLLLTLPLLETTFIHLEDFTKIFIQL